MHSFLKNILLNCFILFRNLGKITGLRKGNVTCSNQAELKAAIKLIKVASKSGRKKLLPILSHDYKPKILDIKYMYFFN